MSSRKVKDAIFTGTAHQGGVFWHNFNDVVKFCQENEGEDLDIQVGLSVNTSTKLKMYKFWYKVIVPCAVVGFTYAGYQNLDNVKADYMLRAELARDYVLRPDGSAMIVVMDKRGMSKARLHKLLSDAIFFIEDELQQGVPSSEDYKLKKDTGIPFKAAK